MTVALSTLLLGMVLTFVGISQPDRAAASKVDAQNTFGVRPVAPGSLAADALNPYSPSQAVKLVFVHHSVGNNWLDDGNGNLGAALGNNNYYVSDTFYEWGPDNIGSYTDIGQWWLWFRGPNSSVYLTTLYTTTNRNASYTRPMADPGGENQIILFKSCYPNSNLTGSPNDPPATGDNPLRGQPAYSLYHSIANAKGIYNDILEYLRTRQDKLFIVITAPPVLEEAYAANARAFNDWLVNDWLAGYPYHNVAVFDFYNVLTTNGGDPNTNDLGGSTGNHHRVATMTTAITIELTTHGDDDAQPNVLEYPTGSDNHPNRAGSLKATGEFVPLLNVYYNCWKYGECGAAASSWISVTAVNTTASVPAGERATIVLLLAASDNVTAPVTMTLHGAPAATLASFQPNPVAPPGASQLDITTSASTTAGTYALTITGTSEGLASTANVTLTVSSIAPGLTLSISPATRAAKPGEIAPFSVVVSEANGFGLPVTLSVTGLPMGVGTLWSVNPITPGNASILTLSIPVSPPYGKHPLQVVGTAEGQVVAESIELFIDYPFQSYLPIILKQG